MSTKTTNAPWEPTAWMREALARRAAMIDAQVHDPDPASLSVVTPLSGSTPAAGSREDRTCDRCRVYVPPTSPPARPRFYIGAVHRTRTDGLAALVTFGLCRRCASAEGWEL